jgi:hypothetical protein
LGISGPPVIRFVSVEDHHYRLPPVFWKGDAGQTLAFVAVVIDCIDATAKAFYSHWDFSELPGLPFRLFLSAKRPEAMIHGGWRDALRQQTSPDLPILPDSWLAPFVPI